MKQVAYREQRETKNGAPQIGIMAGAALISPMHPGKKVKCFADVSKNDQQQTARTDYL